MRSNLPNSNSYLSSFLQASLCVPIEEREDEAVPLLFETSDGEILTVFSSALAMSMFFEREVKFTESPPQAVLALAKDHGTQIGFDLGQAHQVLLTEPDIDGLLDLISRREHLVSKSKLKMRAFAPSIDLQNALMENLRAGVHAYLIDEADEGLIVLVEIDPETTTHEDVVEMRSSLLAIKETDTIGLIAIPKGHERWTDLQADLERFAHKIDWALAKQDRKPPILR